jgi:hypothetical protein
MPFSVPVETTYTRIGLQVQTAAASSTIRLLIYNAEATEGYPEDILLNAGTVDSSSTGAKEITISETLSAGHYWVACVPDGTPAVSGSLSIEDHSAHILGMDSATDGTGRVSFNKSGAGYADTPPDPAPASLGVNTDNPRVWMRDL